MPDAKAEKLPEAALLILNAFLLLPLIQVVMLAEDILDINVETIITVILWLTMCYINRRVLLTNNRAARILTRYPVKSTSKVWAKVFFGTLLLITLLMAFFP